jgi:hypothetical protein
MAHRTVNSTCLVCNRTVWAESPQPGTLEAVAPDCPVCTGQSGNGQLLQTSTIDWRGQGTGHVRCASDCLVRPTTDAAAFLSNGYNWGGGYIYPFNRLFEGVGAQATYQDINATAVLSCKKCYCNIPRHKSAIYTPSIGYLKVWEPKQHTKT